MKTSLEKRDMKGALAITGVVALLICACFFYSWTTPLPLPVDQHLEMIDLSKGFTVSQNTTGGGSKTEKKVEQEDTTPKETSTVETQEQSSTTSSAKTNESHKEIKVEETAKEEKVETKWGYGGKKSDESGEEGQGGDGEGSGKGDGKGAGKDGYNGIDIGGNLAGRALVKFPKLSANCQDAGKVVVKIKVNSAGDVTDPRVDLGKSTGTSACLQNKAIQLAKEMKFAGSKYIKQSGTVTFKFE